jgi:hypothetical protein
LALKAKRLLVAEEDISGLELFLCCEKYCFWGLLGLGIATNRINAQSLANTVAPEAR